jgi:hypothetical protein
MYLKAIMLSNICLSDGVSLDSAMLADRTSPTSTISTWVIVNQARPHEASWKLWRRACSLWSIKNQLYHPLGDWMCPANLLHCKWPVYCEHNTSDLYVHNLTGFTRCIATDPIRYSPISDGFWTPTSTSLPIPARVMIQGDTWFPLLPPSQPSKLSLNPPATFQQFLNQLDSWETQLFLELHMEVDCYECLHLVNSQALEERVIQLLMVSDGLDDSGCL